MKRLRLAVLFFLALTGAAAAPVEHDLGHGLVYVRVHELPADLPTKPAGPRVPPCVVDLRYVQAEPEAATAFVAWLRFRASPRTPVFVLANADTSPTLLRPLARHGRDAGIVVVGAAVRGFQPDVAVKTSADDERRAYTAREQGAALASLLADNPGKARNDEASLSRDRLAEAAAGEAAADRREPPPPVDATLQRAVHLHRTLEALNRI